MRVSLLASLVCCWLVHQPARAEACDDDDDATEIDADTDLSKALSDDAKAKLDRVADRLDHTQLAFEVPDVQIPDVNIDVDIDIDIDFDFDIDFSTTTTTRAMDPSTPRRTPLFADEPIAELRGLAALTDPDDDVAAVIDLAVMGARGDGKTQFLVHAIRALHGRAPALTGGEQELNLAMMRHGPRSARAASGRDTAGRRAALHVSRARGRAVRAARLAELASARVSARARSPGSSCVACSLAVAGLAMALRGPLAPAVIVGASGAVLGAIAALIARGGSRPPARSRSCSGTSPASRSTRRARRTITRCSAGS